MEPINSKHIVKRFICWVLLLQMIHVSIDTVSPSGFSARGFFYEATATEHHTDTVFEWLTVTFFNASLTQKDAPSGDKNEESSLLEDFSNCIVWPPFDPEFRLSGLPERLTENFGHYSDHFVPHYGEPNSPPPNRAS
ncbi:MAG: hypothetical protein U0X91_30490 [Spirosomataceae bacterium]